MSTYSANRPNVRASGNCPLCQQPKLIGELVCDACYKKHDFKAGIEMPEGILLDRAERALMGDTKRDALDDAIDSAIESLKQGRRPR